jgi:hypothetical protein
MAFRSKDNMIYDELWDVVPAGAASSVQHGVGAVRQDVFGFYYSTNLSAGDEVTFIYRQRQVLSDKVTGTGEAIISGDRLYHIVAQNAVSPNIPVGGVAGTDYYFCGWAKKNAGANVDEVLMNFDGTRYDQNF